MVDSSSRAPDLLVENPDDGIFVLRLNRPHAKNAVSFEMWERASAALDQLEEQTPRAIILAGADNFFSAGGDMKAPPNRGEGALAQAARLQMGQRIIARIRALPALSIAAVEGRAIGFGWGLALSCDLLIAAEDAVFTAPFIGLGLVPDGGLAYYLARRVGRHRAAELLFSGRNLGAAEALGLGLASRIVPAGSTLAEAVAFAKRIGPTHAAELTKRLLHAAESGELDQVQALEAAYCHISYLDEESRSARAKFAAGRFRPGGSQDDP
jgi:2-(1,2-epoxy-1,2-dihydrophenyl)acetyl-CoA isomerase